MRVLGADVTLIPAVRLRSMMRDSLNSYVHRTDWKCQSVCMLCLYVSQQLIIFYPAGPLEHPPVMM